MQWICDTCKNRNNLKDCTQRTTLQRKLDKRLFNQLISVIKYLSRKQQNNNSKINLAKIFADLVFPNFFPSLFFASPVYCFRSTKFNSLKEKHLNIKKNLKQFPISICFDKIGFNSKTYILKCFQCYLWTFFRPEKMSVCTQMELEKNTT